MKKDSTETDVLFLTIKYSIVLYAMTTDLETLESLRVKLKTKKSGGHTGNTAHQDASIQKRKKNLKALQSSISEKLGEAALEECMSLFKMNKAAQTNCNDPVKIREKQIEKLKKLNLLPAECISELETNNNGIRQKNNEGSIELILYFLRHYKKPFDQCPAFSKSDKKTMPGLAALVVGFDSPFVIESLAKHGLNFAPQAATEQEFFSTPLVMCSRNTPAPTRALKKILEIAPIHTFDHLTQAHAILTSIQNRHYSVTELLIDAGITLLPYPKELCYPTNNPLALILTEHYTDTIKSTAIEITQAQNIIQNICKTLNEDDLEKLMTINIIDEVRHTIFSSIVDRYTLNEIAESFLKSISKSILARHIDQPDAEGKTPLRMVAELNDFHKAYLLLRAGANPNAPTNAPDGQPYVGAFGQFMRLLLLRHGATPKESGLTNITNMRPLQYELLFGEVESVKILIDLGHSVNTIGDEQLPLRSAFNEIHPCFKIRNTDGQQDFSTMMTLLHQESTSNRLTPLERCIAKLELLLNAKANPNGCVNNNVRQPFLAFALLNKLTQVIDLLIRHRVKINLYTILYVVEHYDETKESCEILRKLLMAPQCRMSVLPIIKSITSKKPALLKIFFEIIRERNAHNTHKSIYFYSLFCAYMTDVTKQNYLFKQLADILFNFLEYEPDTNIEYETIPELRSYILEEMKGSKKDLNLSTKLFTQYCQKRIEEIAKEKAERFEEKTKRHSIENTCAEKPLTGISYLVKTYGFSYQEVRKMQEEDLNPDNDNNAPIAPTKQKIITWNKNQLDSDHPELNQLENSKHCVFISSSLMQEQGCLDEHVLNKLSTVRRFGEKENRCLKHIDNSQNWPVTIEILGCSIDTFISHEIRDNSIPDRILIAPVMKSDEDNVQLYVAVKYCKTGLHTEGAIKAAQESLRAQPVIIDIKSNVLTLQ